MGQILGSAQDIDIDVTGGSSYKTLVCLASSSVNTTLDTSTDQTNCGVLTAPGQPSMTISFDAVCEVVPSGSQTSYSAMLAASVNKTLIAVRVQSPAFTGTSAGAIYYHQFSAYVTGVTLTQATAEFMKFSGTITSTGTLDITV